VTVAVTDEELIEFVDQWCVGLEVGIDLAWTEDNMPVWIEFTRTVQQLNYAVRDLQSFDEEARDHAREYLTMYYERHVALNER
jgi:hypothetical protein